MLTKMYVHNYRCLVNFEIEFDSLMLLLGANGSGKTSLFDILYCIRKLVVDNAKVYEVFTADDLTVWLDSQQQIFELHVEGNGGSYVLQVSCRASKRTWKAKIEKRNIKLRWKTTVLF